MENAFAGCCCVRWACDPGLYLRSQFELPVYHAIDNCCGRNALTVQCGLT